MVKDKKEALIQLQMKLLEVIRNIEDEPAGPEILVATEDFEFELKYSKKLKRFLVLVKTDN